jgi:hypothetical protein
LEGVVGANWGLYSVDRKEVFPLTGKVFENPEWQKSLVSSIIIFMIVSLRYWKVLQELPTVRLLTFLGLLQVLSILLVDQTHTLWYTSYNDPQRLFTLFIIGLNILSGGLILRRAYTLLADHAGSPKLGERLYTLYVVVSLYALFKTGQLAIEGRYISFPTVVTYIPIIGLIGLIVISTLTHAQRQLKNIGLATLLGDENKQPTQDKIIGSLLLLAGIALIIGETYAFMISRDLIAEQPEFWTRLRVCLTFTLTNGQLLGWLAFLGILSSSLLLSDDEIKEE